ncbi:putative dipeptidyl aminopeptidase C2E11.08 [Schizosaccharomyces pombe]|uniref:Putative dipeptidyl aminopeptidase C2E11.08 n=1 Tax=Schizosaccharomyces pombe (strain 972 / ATCC 24843) TaxID=284812 RepID=YEA8_SCHPO|nr:putative dipeptidyl peptidase [Schizosaccharomyces pombe]O14073.1 RecName: Full=Putative dipeptidyl aminopeptidase C2E11.08 [Schizosaccharomyces pombe 972h-]CAA20138.1 dipeptidyl peptidase (predicted) [Schizosaccharomyces pombe]|eukprot:NP_593970.1 putative dipeptidyl peptidase [Schizosaccharomyces pombe]
MNDFSFEDKGLISRSGFGSRHVRRVVKALALIFSLLILYLTISNVSDSPPKRDSLSLDDIVLQKYKPSYKQVNWIDSQGLKDTFLVKYGDLINIQDPYNLNKTLFSVSDLVYNGIQLDYDSYSISFDAKYVLVSVNKSQRWRHSSFAQYYLYNTETKDVNMLGQDNEHWTISLAEWSPTGHQLSFVYNNDLYVRKNDGNVQRLTYDGTVDVFNGLTDWIYEEEVLSSPSTIWWSPDSDKIAFLKLNESEIPTYHYPLYTAELDPSLPEFDYNKDMAIKYPKPGNPNPSVSLFVADLNSNASSNFSLWHNEPLAEPVVQNVLWVNTSSVLVQFTNRNSTCITARLLDTELKSIHTVKTECLEEGWYEVQQSAKMFPLNNSLVWENWSDGYFDILALDDYNHLAFIPFNGSSPIYLTSGAWDVTDGPIHIDGDFGNVYFLATLKDSTERHLYYVSLDTLEIYGITDNGEDEGYYSTSFSPFGDFYVLNYHGPDVPWQELRSTKDKDYCLSLETNSRLKQQLSSITLPSVEYGKLTFNDTTFNFMERRPRNFDVNKKYPVLFFAYGGPGSQQVAKLFRVDFQAYLASHPDFEFIVVTLDGRGTGFNGNAFRYSVSRHLGEWESYDQGQAGKFWADLPFVDENHVGIWGWSYGGYLTLKTLETQDVFSYGMAVAPVTDWRLYDSVYTERYMDLPQYNKEGYKNSQIHDYEKFKQLKRFFVAHGTGDDNVHFQHSMHLMDGLNLANCYNYDMAVFPDSAHSISYHNASLSIYHRLSEWIGDALGRIDPSTGVRQHRWD